MPNLKPNQSPDLPEVAEPSQDTPNPSELQEVAEADLGAGIQPRHSPRRGKQDK